MEYKQAYLGLFNQVTSITEFLSQQPQTPLCVYLQEKLIAAQKEAEERCIRK